ncbi:MAG: S8 family serine peptidase [Actinomycetota bacterium]
MPARRNVRIRRCLLAVSMILLVAALPAVAPAAPSGDAGGRWIRVQFEGRIKPADRAAMEETGLRAIQYVPDDAYVAYAASDAARGDAASLARVSGVRSVTVEEKLDDGMRALDGIVLADIVAFGPAARATSTRLGVVGELVDRYALEGDDELSSIILRLPVTSLRRVARDPAVLWVGPAATGFYTEDEASVQILAGNVSGGEPVVGYESWLTSVGLDGEGVIVSIADTGIDKSHPEHQGRVVKEIFYGAAQSNDQGGHGTHVAGIVGGRGASLPVTGRARDLNDFLIGHGVAPKVSFVNQAIIPNGSFVGGTPPTDFDPYTADAVRAGAIGWNASWNTGGPANGGYVARARSLDVLVRDADQEAAGNEPFAMVYSAGNSGPNPKTITQPKEAKNIITVGSTQSSRTLQGNIDAMSSFSSRGPTRDGRVAPTVSAPGQDIVSSATSASPAASCAAPTGAGAETFVLGQAKYSPCSGTSMAAPHVTGAVALIADWWRERNGGATSSPAMDKALLVNSATDIGAADVPNGNEGWGRVNLSALFAPTAERVYVDQSVVLTGVGQSHALDVVPADPAKPMRVTLAWTDAPAVAGANPALVNDLDLTVTSPDGSAYLGNVFQSGLSVVGGAADRKNNLENVWLDQASAGVFHIVVSAANLPDDGIPGNEILTDQDFALVISNARAA